MIPSLSTSSRAFVGIAVLVLGIGTVVPSAGGDSEHDKAGATSGKSKPAERIAN